MMAAQTVPTSPLTVELVPTVVVAQGRPAVIARASRAVTQLSLHLDRTGCGAVASVSQSVARLAAGKAHRFELEQPIGSCDYRGTLSALVGGERAELPLSFSTEVAVVPEVRALPGGFDAANGVARVTFNRSADHGQVEAFGEGGRRLAIEADQALGDAAPGEPLSLAIGAVTQPLRLRVTIFDSAGLFGAVDLFPWSIEIPHQEVEFATGSAQIPGGERAKVEESVREIRAAIAKAGKEIPLRLFVAGYTDTVGNADGNQKLSAARAESIARFFRAAGLSLPLLTAGLGEDALRVGTPDETPEPRNRRAEYILAVDPPTIAGAARSPTWMPLR